MPPRPSAWGTAAIGTVAVLAYNATVMLRLRAEAQPHDHDLRHDRVVGAGRGGPPLRLAVLGDSAATGFGLDDPDLAWPGRLADLLAERTDRPVEVRCTAVRGHRIRTVTEQQVARFVGWHPDVVLVSAGGNDVLGRRPPRLVRRDMDDLLDALGATAPDAVVFVGGPSDLGAAPVLPQPSAALLSWWTGVVVAAQREVAGRRGVPFDALPRLDPDDFGPDGFHPGVRAHEAAARLTFAALDAWLDALAGR